MEIGSHKFIKRIMRSLDNPEKAITQIYPITTATVTSEERTDTRAKFVNWTLALIYGIVFGLFGQIIKLDTQVNVV